MEKYIDKWATLSEHKVRYLEEGQRGETILLVHGLGCSALEWSENIRALSKNFHVIAVDLLGFGKSDRPAVFKYTPASQAEMLKNLCLHLNVKSVNVVGNSYGGLVAIEFAKYYPEITNSIVLVNAAGAGLDAPLGMRISSLPIVGEIIVKKNWLSCKQGFEAIMYDRTLLDETRVDTNYSYWLLKGSKHSFLRTVRGMMNLSGFIEPYINDLHQFLRITDVQTLIIWGLHDPLLSINDAHIFQKLIKNSTLKVFESAGHAPMFESPQLFNSSIVSFLEVLGKNKNLHNTFKSSYSEEF